MRITNQTILRGYNRNINRIAAQKTSCMQKIWSGRDFNRASEAPLSAAKALNVRRQLYNTEQYRKTLRLPINSIPRQRLRCFRCLRTLR